MVTSNRNVGNGSAQHTGNDGDGIADHGHPTQKQRPLAVAGDTSVVPCRARAGLLETSVFPSRRALDADAEQPVDGRAEELPTVATAISARTGYRFARMSTTSPASDCIEYRGCCKGHQERPA